MKVTTEDNLRKAVNAYLDAQIARQKEIRDYWAGLHDTGEGNSFLYASYLTTAQDCIDYLHAIKRNAGCEGCNLRSKALQLETEVQLLRDEIKRLNNGR